MQFLRDGRKAGTNYGDMGSQKGSPNVLHVLSFTVKVKLSHYRSEQAHRVPGS
jgi:hypothetical protein